MRSRTSAIFTVYSSRPARNSRVPSSGSTRKNVSPGDSGRSASSETIGTPGKPLASPPTITACAASSASVTGDSSALWRVLTLRQSNRRIAAPARTAMVVRSWAVRRSSARSESSGRSIGCGVSPRELGSTAESQAFRSHRRFDLMAGPVTLESLDLAALLCSRVCHDLISPVGAVVNGIEVLEDDNDESTKTFALDLIKKSARQASARLQFCRLAFGAAGSAGAQIDLGDAESVAR